MERTRVFSQEQCVWMMVQREGGSVDRDKRRAAFMCVYVCMCTWMHVMGAGSKEGEGELIVLWRVSAQNHRNKVLSSRDFSSLTYKVLRIIADRRPTTTTVLAPSFPKPKRWTTPATPAMHRYPHTQNARALHINNHDRSINKYTQKDAPSSLLLPLLPAQQAVAEGGGRRGRWRAGRDSVRAS